jgi:hypothetical protein
MVELTLTVGDTRVLVFPVYDQDADAPLEMVDLQEAVFKITERQAGGDTILERTLDDPGMTIAQVQHIDSVDVSEYPDDQDVIRITLDPADTEQLPEPDVFYELELRDIDGNHATVIQGTIITTSSST